MELTRLPNTSFTIGVDPVANGGDLYPTNDRDRRISSDSRGSEPQPNSDTSNYSPAGKFQAKLALITGGDSASRSLKKINCRPLPK